MNNTILIYNARLVDETMDKKGFAVIIKDGKIDCFPGKQTVKEMLRDENPKIEKIDAKGAVLMPSFIDTHAHFRDPGLTQKEDIITGSKAAAKGGFGTVVLMPNTNPVCSSQAMAKENNDKAKKAGFCNVIQSVSITKDFDGKTISHLDKLDPKVVPVITEDGKEVMDSALMLEAMKKAAAKKIIVSCHCEDPFLAASARPLRMEALKIKSKDPKKAAALLNQADEILACAEDSATDRNLRLAKTAGCHIHLCHVSTAHCVNSAELAAKDGVNVTYEITPHHIWFESGKAPVIFNIVNPPLRKKDDRLELIQALKKGKAFCIGTDHAPHTAEDKKNGAPGFSGIESAFAVCNTVLCKENKVSLKQLSKLMSANPARLLGLKNKGLLVEGYDADLVLVDVDKKWTVSGADFVSKGKFTPLEGKKVTGKILKTFLAGKLVYEETN
ncbi:dihydroorotase [Treponema sp.]|uniref:dihydroorotase n=1 Tax=Treponema sp. TaxID=166 RepID=UPI00298E9707|nr:dihydroorotase [Treponema sp.]MCQ2241144.1 dihydroorotase [Treponema sp.]